jgi:NAD(P)-dependent dehydrogenase (short-subunit alcohol dehydrogenase family)
MSFNSSSSQNYPFGFPQFLARLESFRSRFRARQQDNTVVIAGRWCADEGYAEKRAGPEDAASIALFLASDEAANFTGQDINSGGAVMW